MMTLIKGMVGLSTLVAAGAVSMIDLTDAQPTPASIVIDRFVFAGEVPAGQGVDLTEARRDAAAALAAITHPVEAPAPKADRIDVETNASKGGQACAGLAADCPVTARALVRPPVRYVTFGRQTGPSTSEARRMAQTDVASR